MKRFFAVLALLAGLFTFPALASSDPIGDMIVSYTFAGKKPTAEQLKQEVEIAYSRELPKGQRADVQGIVLEGIKADTVYLGDFLIAYGWNIPVVATIYDANNKIIDSQARVAVWLDRELVAVCQTHKLVDPQKRVPDSKGADKCVFANTGRLFSFPAFKRFMEQPVDFK